jgi:hypothetical protein
MRSFFAVSTLLSVMTFAGVPAAQAQPAPASVEDQIKASAEGVGRFRGGFYGAFGWGLGSKIDDAATGGTRPSGLALDGGMYALFNPIRDFADIEAGIGVRGLLPTSQSTSNGSVSYKSGYIALTLYAGPVFRFGDGGRTAIALGAQFDAAAKVLKEDADPFYGLYSGKLKPAVGVYGEYQYKGSDGTKAIYYTRLNAYRYDVSFSGAPARINEQGKGNLLANLVFGIKY